MCFCSATQFHVSEVSLGFPAGDTSSLLRQGQHHRCRKTFFYWKSIPIIFVALLRRFCIKCHCSCDLGYKVSFLSTLIRCWCPCNYKKIPKDSAYTYIFVELSSPTLAFGMKEIFQVCFSIPTRSKRRFCSKNKTYCVGQCCRRTCKYVESKGCSCYTTGVTTCHCATGHLLLE